MLKSFLFGFAANVGLLIGVFWGLRFKLNRKAAASIMAFGSGILVATVSFELMKEAYLIGSFDAVTIGFFVGGLAFTALDYLVDKKGGSFRKYYKSTKSNLLNSIPEGISGVYGLINAKKDRKFIIWLWVAVVFVCTLSAVLGYTLFREASEDVIALVLSIAAGTTLVMVGETMISEAYNEGGRAISISLMLGFTVFFISLI